MSILQVRSVSPALAALALGLVTLPLLGCAQGPESGEVEGTVTLNGKPLTAGSVVFSTKDGIGPGAIDKDGTYYAPHVPAGEATVTVIVPPWMPGSKTAAPAVPKKYLDPATSDLKTTIRPGTNSFNVDLK